MANNSIISISWTSCPTSWLKVGVGVVLLISNMKIVSPIVTVSGSLLVHHKIQLLREGPIARRQN